MSKVAKLYEKLVEGASDANFSFDDLCTLLIKLGYEMRPSKGSHVIFKHGESFINLQNQGGKAKIYQVRQVREELNKYKIRPE